VARCCNVVTRSSAVTGRARVRGAIATAST
jgi:hypothetical protein